MNKDIRKEIEEILKRGHEFAPSDAHNICQYCGRWEDEHEIDKVKEILSLITSEKIALLKLMKEEELGLSLYEEATDPNNAERKRITNKAIKTFNAKIAKMIASLEKGE